MGVDERPGLLVECGFRVERSVSGSPGAEGAELVAAGLELGWEVEGTMRRDW